MKPTKKTKSPSAIKPADNQLTLDLLAQAVTELNLSVAALWKWRYECTERPTTERMVTNYDRTEAAEPKRPALKWVEQEPQHISWTIYVDPTTLILTPGTTLRYNIDEAQVTTYDGVVVGELNTVGHDCITRAVKQGAKLHVYLTTSRKLGIKLGR